MPMAHPSAVVPTQNALSSSEAMTPPTVIVTSGMTKVA